jgi:hypothetical protein
MSRAFAGGYFFETLRHAMEIYEPSNHAARALELQSKR